MRSLFIFDENIDVGGINNLPDNDIDFFSLTSNHNLIEQCNKIVKAKIKGFIKSLDSAKSINDKIIFLRENICRYSAEIGEKEVWSKKIKDWFVLPHKEITTWWFSIISEKNNFKTDAFFNFARIDAIKELLISNEYEYLILSVFDKTFEKSIVNIARKINVKILTISSRKINGLKNSLKHILRKSTLINEIFYGFYIFIIFFYKYYKTRKLLPNIEQRFPTKHSLLFVSYFPAADKVAAQKGIFKNAYYTALQEKLLNKNIPYSWLLMDVNKPDIQFIESLEQAKAFIKNGEKIWYIHEFFSVQQLINCIVLWIRQTIISLIIYKTAMKKIFNEPVMQDYSPILRTLWFKSFCGVYGVEGILYYNAFEKVFTHLRNISDVLYCAEMHAWEKALNSAKQNNNPLIRTIGFQHAAISSYYFHYFYHPTEINATYRKTAIPLPDVFAVTSKNTKKLIENCGYNNLANVESIRHIYINKQLSDDNFRKKEKQVFLVAGSINKIETKALVFMVHNAFPQIHEFDIWFKAHPRCPFETIFKELGINDKKSGYIIRNDSISDVLKMAKVVFVPTSTVSIEALAFGCEVIIPLLPDSIMMNPLIDHDGLFYKISSPKELKEIVNTIINKEDDLDRVKLYKEFVRNYWNINPELPMWEKLLSINHQHE